MEVISMGKRGPAPKGEYTGKSKVLSTRIRPDTREALSAAAKASGRSLSQEIEHRLRRSFLEDEKIADMFGTRQTFLIMRITALALQRAWNPDKPEADWLNDPFAFEQAVKIVAAVLEAIRPPGEIEPQSDVLQDVIKMAPTQTSATLWKAIQDANPALPLTEGTRKQHLASILKTDLGEIANRPKIFYGTAKDIRRHADELEKEEQKKAQQFQKRGRRK
jgi:hypothetical protein